MNEYWVPTLKDVFQARKIIYRYFRPSPLRRFADIDRITGTATYLKLENVLPTRSFKARGSIYLISKLTEEERNNGVIAASTGNFSQGVSYAASLMGVRATIVMPDNANPIKVRATRDLGGEVIFHGEKFDDAREHAEELARKHGYRYIHSANEPLLVAGVATHTLEMLEEQPEIDTIIVPVGGGSGASAACVAAMSVDKDIRVIGVQSESSPAAYLSWKAGKIVKSENRTFAEGLATGEGYEYTVKILHDNLSDFVTVSDDEIWKAMKIFLDSTHTVAEPAAASTLAAAIKLSDSLKGRKIGLIISGGNASDEQLKSLLSM